MKSLFSVSPDVAWENDYTAGFPTKGPQRNVYERRQGSYKKLQPFFKDFSRTPLDFQGPPTRNIISQIVQKRTFPAHSNKALTLELSASPTSLHFSIHLS